MTRFAPVCMVLAACGFNSSMGSPDAPPRDDAAADAAIDTPEIDAPDLCIGNGAHQVCFAALPTTPRIFIDQATLDTSEASTCAPTTNAAAAGWCVIAASTIEIQSGAKVRAIGAKPIVFAATGDIIVVGIIDAGSRGNAIGAGANAAGCLVGTNATEGNSSGGGYGGSYGGRGGNGEGNDGGAGGISPGAASDPAVLRGGCPGGPGGPIGGTLAAGGAGGGAMALLSRTKIQLAVGGALNASGAGGRVGELVRQGSGGGGSGGMIVLDAPTIIATGAYIYANGGGGGEGNDLVTVGVAGKEAPSPSTPAAGGAGTSAGGDGGAGSLGGNGGVPPMNASSANAGGGGGGGGTGVIVTNVPLTGAEVSPGPVGMQL